MSIQAFHIVTVAEVFCRFSASNSKFSFKKPKKNSNALNLAYILEEHMKRFQTKRVGFLRGRRVDLVIFFFFVKNNTKK